MKVTPILSLVACSIGLFSTISVSHAQGSWQVYSEVPAMGYPVQQSTGTGTGSTGIDFDNPDTTQAFSITSIANASFSGNGLQSSSADYESSDIITYSWTGTGPPNFTFHVNITPTATASCTYSNGGNVRWSATGNASTNPSSLTANAMQGYSGPSTSNNPGSLNYQFNPNGALTTSWTVTVTAKASGSVLYATGSYTAAATGKIAFGAPTN